MTKLVEIPITERARRYGYLIWRKKQDGEVRALLGEVGCVAICGAVEQQAKRVDWKQRRISVTYSFTRGLPGSASKFLLQRARQKIALTVA